MLHGSAGSRSRGGPVQHNASGRNAWCGLGSLCGEISQYEHLVAPQRAQDLMRPQGSAELSALGVNGLGSSLGYT